MPFLCAVRCKPQKQTIPPRLFEIFKHRKSHYQYSKLAKNQIRLLSLQPGAPRDVIACTLHVVDLLAYDDIGAESSIDGFERFEAISYVWGNPEHTEEIECKMLRDEYCMVGLRSMLIDTGGGRKTNVTRNLADALRTLRHESVVKILWADALCINQNDMRERAEQVKLMGLIYWKACRVRVWLGRDDSADTSHRAKHATRVIKAYADISSRGLIPEHCKSYRDVKYEEPGDITEHEWTAIHSLLDRPWFQRVWVVQELGVARDATFHCGEESFTSSELREFRFILGEFKSNLVDTQRMNVQMLVLGMDYWRSCWGNERLELGSDPKKAETFLDLLEGARGLSCTDPRDGVYAFLGHPSAFKRQLLDIDPYNWYPRNYYCNRATIIAPNYSKSITPLDVYHLLATKAIADVGLGLNVLSHVTHTRETIESAFPSWVPRWDVNSHPEFLGTRFYFAASGASSSTGFELSSSKRKGMLDQLSFKAFRLDTVRCVRGIPVTQFLGECLDIMALLLSDAPKMKRPNAIPIPKSLVYPYEEPFVLAFASTMTAGLTSSRQAICEPTDQKPSQQLRNFHAYYRQTCVPYTSALYDGEAEDAEDFASDIRAAASKRLLFITHDGRLGLGPRVMEGSDEIWIPMGAKMPIVLRRYDNGKHKIIGQAYVYGVMRGEVFQEELTRDIETITVF